MTVACRPGLEVCRTGGVESKNRPQRGQFLPDLQPNSRAIGQKDGEKWAAAVGSQPTIRKSDRLLGIAEQLALFERAASARGCTLPAPPEQLAHGFHAMINGLIYGWLLDQSFDLPATGEVSMQAYLRGIGLHTA